MWQNPAEFKGSRRNSVELGETRWDSEDGGIWKNTVRTKQSLMKHTASVSYNIWQKWFVRAGVLLRRKRWRNQRLERHAYQEMFDMICLIMILPLVAARSGQFGVRMLKQLPSSAWSSSPSFSEWANNYTKRWWWCGCEMRCVPGAQNKMQSDAKWSRLH